MTPNQLLRKARKDHDLTLAEMATLLDTSNQRVSQWESGDPITQDRIDSWTKDESLPEWVRKMAFDIAIASVRQTIQTSSDRLTELESRIQSTVAA